MSGSLNPYVWSVNLSQVPTTDEVESQKLTLLSAAGGKIHFRLPPRYAPRRGRPSSKEQKRKKSAIEKAGGMQTRGKKERGVLANVQRNSKLHAEVAEKAEVRLVMTPPCYSVRVLQDMLSAVTVI